jgi:Chalcone isomerase-like
MTLPSLPFLHALFKRLVLVSLVLAGANASAASIAGVSFEDRIRLADTDLVLNGTGLRAVLMFKGYAAGLYLQKKARTPEQVLATPGAKRVQMKMLLDVEAKEFVKAIDVGVKRNSSEAQQAALKERMAQFDRNVAQIGTVKKGDVVNLDFIPSRGLLLTLNGQPRGEPIAGDDLYAGVLKIFIGELPVDKKLKAGLLGTPTP